ncbi:MAG: hypothetical protein HYY80_01100, partial [Chloroflexi bacterium]|nr:hypothetical protein [Chloroflexota bacterium]
VVKPAEFVVTSLRVVPAPELGEGYYHVTVAIENVGALPGVYQLKCRVSDEEMAPIEVELTAGEKKTVTLTGAEATIRELAANYKNAKTDQREQVVSIAGLSETVTFPARPVVQPTYTPPTKPAVTPPPPAPAPVIKLQVLYVEPHMEEGSYAYVAGEVKNISDESLANVEAVVNFYTNEGRLMNTLRAVIEQTPLLAGKKSRFKVAGYVDATVARYSLRFQFLAGDVILHKVERE